MESKVVEEINGYGARIAYFSMEVGLTEDIPTYSGGLGILAGDTLKAGTDLQLPMLGITLLHEKGYFVQKLDSDGNQSEEPVDWDPSSFMELLPNIVQVNIDGRVVHIHAWRYWIDGLTGNRVPLYFLDTNLEENSEEDREITTYLYGGDDEYRLKQEVVLGIGGVRMLRSMGYDDLSTFHMNEGHASLLTLELLKENKKSLEEVWYEEAVWDPALVRDLCVFTTHTPVPAGHDRFSKNLVKKILGRKDERLSDRDGWLINDIPLKVVEQLSGEEDFHMTLLALNLSRYANGVAKKHGEVSKEMFPEYEIDSITNGVHVRTWASEPFQRLFDKYLQGWKSDSFLLRHAACIPNEELWMAHQECKHQLLGYVNETTDIKLDPDVLTIGFARRATTYKRADLLFSDIERIVNIAKNAGKFQLIFAGKAHPKDEPGKDLIRSIFRYAKELSGEIPIIYLEHYNIFLGRLLTSGVDVWLNTPTRPLEASGTSGMKATLNGVLNFSVLDGWWIEGHREGITGWSIGPRPEGSSAMDNSSEIDARDLYEKLEKAIIHRYYNDKRMWIEMMKDALSINGSFFSTNRMMLQYISSAYLRKSIKK
jgi:starch phosphorylase